MSKGLFGNWRFRSARPTFAPGEEIRAYLTGIDVASGEGTIRVGDTVLSVRGADPRQLDQLVTVQVEAFDPAQATGRARLVNG